MKIYNVLSAINFWSIRFVKPGRFTVIIDCCEMKVQQPSAITNAQLIFSSYKHSCTFKILAGCDERGVVTFVSDLYSGGISDKGITEKCGLLQLLAPGESVLADRGFDISDLLLARQCSLNLPNFCRNSQFSESEMEENRKCGNRRIIIENVNCRAKKWKILERIDHNYNHIANFIVKNCFYLVNFCQPLKDLKNENSTKHRDILKERITKKIEDEFK